MEFTFAFVWASSLRSLVLPLRPPRPAFPPLSWGSAASSSKPTRTGMEEIDGQTDAPWHPLLFPPPLPEKLPDLVGQAGRFESWQASMRDCPWAG